MNRHIVLFVVLLKHPRTNAGTVLHLVPWWVIAAFVLAHWGLLYLPLHVAIPPLFVNLQMNYFLPIHHQPIWGGRPARRGKLGHVEMEKPKGIYLHERMFGGMYPQAGR